MDRKGSIEENDKSVGAQAAGLGHTLGGAAKGAMGQEDDQCLMGSSRGPGSQAGT